MIAIFLAFSAVALAPDAIEGSPFPPTGGRVQLAQTDFTRQQLDYFYERQSKALQEEMQALQKSDGGTLTAEHRAYLQAKLEALVRAYRSDVQKYDRYGRNADGTPKR